MRNHPTLSEFLLARIAEDEAAVRGDYLRPELDARRPLGECEAKRRIVEAWQRLDREDTTDFVEGGAWDPGIGYAADALNLALRAHAAVYADHPDFRDEWMP